MFSCSSIHYTNIKTIISKSVYNWERLSYNKMLQFSKSTYNYNLHVDDKISLYILKFIKGRDRGKNYLPIFWFYKYWVRFDFEEQKKSTHLDWDQRKMCIRKHFFDYWNIYITESLIIYLLYLIRYNTTGMLFTQPFFVFRFVEVEVWRKNFIKFKIAFFLIELLLNFLEKTFF